MPITPIAVYPADFKSNAGGNIKNASTLTPNPLDAGTGNAWVATIKGTDGVYRFSYAALAADVTSTAVDTPNHLVSVPYLKAYLASNTPASATNVSLTWDSAASAYKLKDSTNTTIVGTAIPLATQSTRGLTQLALGSQASDATLNNSDTLTPTNAYVNNKLATTLQQAAVAAAQAEVKISTTAYNPATRIFNISETNGGSFDTALPLATQIAAGLVSYMVKFADYPAKLTDDTGAATPAFVKKAVDTAIGNLPVDKVLQSGSYDPATNLLTLNVGGSPASTTAININMQTLLDDVIATIANASDGSRGLVQLNLGNTVGDDTNNTDALTAGGFVNLLNSAMGGTPNAVSNLILALVGTATTTSKGVTTLADLAFVNANTANNTRAVTPSALTGYAGNAVAKAHDFATIATATAANLDIAQGGTASNQNLKVDFKGVNVNAPLLGKGIAGNELGLDLGAGLSVVGGKLTVAGSSSGVSLTNNTLTGLQPNTFYEIVLSTQGFTEARIAFNGGTALFASQAIYTDFVGNSVTNNPTIGSIGGESGFGAGKFTLYTGGGTVSKPAYLAFGLRNNVEDPSGNNARVLFEGYRQIGQTGNVVVSSLHLASMANLAAPLPITTCLVNKLGVSIV